MGSLCLCLCTCHIRKYSANSRVCSYRAIITLNLLVREAQTELQDFIYIGSSYKKLMTMKIDQFVQN